MTGVIPARAGVGLKPAHYRVILETKPAVGFFEVHAENYMGAGGPPHRYLEAIRARYPISLHGVGLSIGADRPVDAEHLARLEALCTRYEPGLFSEHLAWSSHGESFLNDLLPLPYTEETLARVCEHIDHVQEALRRRMLLENPATYVRFAQSTIPEPAFLASISARTGCGLLLDVNNLYVSAVNHGFDPFAYLAALPVEVVAEIHLAGFAESADDEGRRLLIDNHGSAVRDVVWALYADALRRLGPVPTLIEWDNDVPAWPTLLSEAERADQALLFDTSQTSLRASDAAVAR
jgi:uncharacterized protein (UPF0276 family)